MTTQVIPFDFNSHPVRILDLDGQPWFVATDVASALEYRDAGNMTRFLDEDEAATRTVSVRSSSGVEQNREVITINESGLYHAILKSRKPAAKAFRSWVTSEVLPSLRKTGVYGTIDPSKRLAISKQILEVTTRLVRTRNKLVENICTQELRDLYALIGKPCPDLTNIREQLPDPMMPSFPEEPR